MDKKAQYEEAARRRRAEMEATCEKAKAVNFHNLGADVDGRLITWEEIQAVCYAAAMKHGEGSKGQGDLIQAAHYYLPTVRRLTEVSEGE